MKLKKIDLSENLIEKNFQLVTRYLKENCEQLSEIALAENKGIRKGGNTQIAKAKIKGMSSLTPLL